MNLAVFERMEVLARGCLSIFGNPEVSREADNLGTAMLSEEHLLEQMRRVQLARLKMRKNSGVPHRGKTDLSEKIGRFI